MPRIQLSTIIKSPPERVYQALKDMESFPAIMRDVKSLKIIKSSENKLLTAWETEIDGAPVNWKEEDLFDDNLLQLKFSMTEGNYKEYQGYWQVENCYQGAKLTICADFDWGIPILEKYVGKALQDKARRGLLGMLQAIKNKVEKINV